MTLALRLAGFGVASTIVDPLGPEIDPGSKALLMAGEALEILERVGVGRTIAKRGVRLAAGRTFVRDRELATVRFSHTGSGFPPVLNFPQAETERLLLARVEREPLVETLWGSALVEVEQNGGGVTAHLEGEGGARTMRALYLAGCDGVRSAARKGLGVRFAGHGFDDHFLITDVRADLPFPRNERRFLFDPPFNPGRTVLVHPQPDGCWHIDWQIGEALDAEEERRSGRLDARLRSLVGETPYDLLWVTSYRFLQLIAERFRVGRAFLLGDAAHVYSPYGARGLNSGLADAENLAWKLWLVLSGAAPARLLETYEAERRAAALENLRITARTARFMAPPSRARRVFRDAVLATAARVPPTRRFVNSGRFYQPHVYADSPIVAVGAGGMAPDAARSGGGFVALLTLPPGASAGTGAEVADRAARAGLPVRLALAGDSRGRLLLVRPDGHIASEHHFAHPSELDGLDRWLRAAVGD